ncbi:hypothetical protein ROSEINA2194_03047 [Roseburia inulinivorans DSM 16841]|uniref:Uncharacterized protein n=1 Tax=Roseburia inulinivorans DSM 16841 TaxID=622312 RepID=C0FWB9_9FIRM|nr:hypothetical protein ROSEINA2194_03047 [Roseburia inulinivorans DSM 16841]
MGKKQKITVHTIVRQRIKRRLYTKMTRTMNTFMRMDSTRVRMEEMAAAMERTDRFPVFIRL